LCCAGRKILVCPLNLVRQARYVACRDAYVFEMLVSFVGRKVRGKLGRRAVGINERLEIVSQQTYGLGKADIFFALLTIHCQ